MNRHRGRTLRRRSIPLLLAGLAGLAACGSESAPPLQITAPDPAVEVDDDREPLGRWMSEYYLDPDPVHVAWGIEEMTRTGFWDKPGRGASGSAFLSEIFRRHPAYVRAWASLREGKPDDHQHWILLAVWIADVDDSIAILEEAAANAGGDLAESLRGYLESVPRSVRNLAVDSPYRLDLMWGGFFATGDPVFVEKIISVLAWDLAEGEDAALLLVQSAARWSLDSNARQCERIAAICEAERKQATGRLREELDAILDETEPDPKTDR